MNTTPSTLWNQLIQIYAIVTAVLYLKYFALQLYSAELNNHPPEDEGKFGYVNEFIYLCSSVSNLPTFSMHLNDIPPDIKRRSRAFANGLENIPFHLGIFVLAFLVQNLVNLFGDGTVGSRALCVLYVVYALLRVLHTTFYLLAIQPYRTLCFILSQAVMMATVAVLIYSAFSVNASTLANR